jgi:hypothetical protein
MDALLCFVFCFSATLPWGMVRGIEKEHFGDIEFGRTSDLFHRWLAWLRGVCDDAAHR